MISLNKISQLPRVQRLRKIEKMMAEADRQAAGLLPVPKDLSNSLELLANAVSLLVEDDQFMPEELTALKESAGELAAAHQSYSTVLPRRPINVVRHILARSIGKQIADWDFVDGNGKLSARDRKVIPGIQIYLEDIRSPFNVGSIFRTAEAFGVEKVWISPLCALPSHPRAARSSMGCTDLVPWEQRGIEDLKLPIFALETGGKSIEDFSFPDRGIMILGSEELGVSPGLLEKADASAGRVSIPLFGAKGSLNVAVAYGIAAKAWATALLTGNCANFRS